MQSVLILKLLAVGFAGIVLSCLVSIMALFMGGGQAGVDLHALMVLQIMSVPAAIIAIVLGLVLCKTARNARITFGSLYDAVPQWLVFIFLMQLLLVSFGEIAFLVVSRTTDTTIAWTEHAPLAGMLSCSLAICVLYACAGLISGKTKTLSGRWSA